MGVSVVAPTSIKMHVEFSVKPVFTLSFIMLDINTFQHVPLSHSWIATATKLQNSHMIVNSVSLRNRKVIGQCRYHVKHSDQLATTFICIKIVTQYNGELAI